MTLQQWRDGMSRVLFPEGATNVRFLCSDGYELCQIYREFARQNPELADERLLRDENEILKNFFRAVINEIFMDESVARRCRGRIRLTTLADELGNRTITDSDGHKSFDWRILPLCYFFTTMWCYDFEDEDDGNANRDGPGMNDANYRGRLMNAVEWAFDGKGDAPDFELNNNHFSQGIIDLFGLLKEQYGEKLFMPPEGFTYRQSRADGITISHAVFRFGECRSICNEFHARGMRPDRVYGDDLFERIGRGVFSADERCADGETITRCVKNLFDGWDGNVRERIRRNRTAREGVQEANRAVRLKAYWSISEGGWNDFRIGIVIDGILALHNGICVEGCPGIAIPRVAMGVGVSAYFWAGNAIGQVRGWSEFGECDRIRLCDSNTREELCNVISSGTCFDGHAILLLQSFIPPWGGQQMWRLMSGTQNINEWGGDGRGENNRRHAILSPFALQTGSIACGERECQLERVLTSTIEARQYHLHILAGDLHGALTVEVNGEKIKIADFGEDGEPIEPEKHVLGERMDIKEYFGNVFAARQTPTMFYKRDERWIGFYKGCRETVPSLYAISETEITAGEIEPLEEHRLEFEFDEQRELWVCSNVEDAVEDWPPYAVGVANEEENNEEGTRIDFRTLGTHNGLAWHECWKRYFLPRCNREGFELTGALAEGGFDREFNEILHSQNQFEAPEGGVAGNCIAAILNAFDGIEIADKDAKLAIVSDVASSLLTSRIVNGPINGGRRYTFNNMFGTVPEELRDFIDGFPQNGQLASLKHYFVWALILLSIREDRPGIAENPPDNLGVHGFKIYALDGFRPGVPDTRYYPLFVCEGIVNAVLDGLPKDCAKEILRESVRLADCVTSRLTRRARQSSFN